MVIFHDRKQLIISEKIDVSTPCLTLPKASCGYVSSYFRSKQKPAEESLAVFGSTSAPNSNAHRLQILYHNLVAMPTPRYKDSGFGGYNQYSLSLVTSYYRSYFAKGSSYSAYNLSLVFANLAWWPNCTAKGQLFGKKLRILSPSKTWKKCKQPLKKALVFVPSCNDQWKLSKDSGVLPFDIINEEVACLKQCVPYDTHITQTFLVDFTIHHPHTNPCHPRAPLWELQQRKRMP